MPRLYFPLSASADNFATAPPQFRRKPKVFDFAVHRTISLCNAQFRCATHNFAVRQHNFAADRVGNLAVPQGQFSAALPQYLNNVSDLLHLRYIFTNPLAFLISMVYYIPTREKSRHISMPKRPFTEEFLGGKLNL